MALTAGPLITLAVQGSYGIRGNQKVSNAALMAELTFQDEQIVQLVSQVAPDLLATVSGSDTVTLAENRTGYTLAAGIHYRDFTHYDPTSDTFTPVNLVQRHRQDHNLRHPSAMLKLSGNTGVLYPVDPNGERWINGEGRNWWDEGSSHEFRYSYVPAPSVLTALTSTLVSPDMARGVLVSALILAIATAAPGATEIQITKAATNYETAMSRLVFQVHKFGHPAGEHGSADGPVTEQAWVQEQID